MGRLVVVVAVLLIIAFLANKYILHGGDPRPADAPAAGASADAGKAADAAPVTEKDAKKIDAEAAAADAVAAATVSTDVPPAAADSKVGTAAADVTGEELTEVMPEEEIDITDPSLTAGIPGDGPVTIAQLERWLADPKNHVALKPKLPLGLAAGQAGIKGLDKNPLTRAKIELGRQLYFDQRLSSDVSISCASCHIPDAGYAAHTQFGIGVNKQMGGRNSPVAYNRILSDAQFWDGRAASLEEQAKGPIANPIEMSNTHEACVATLKKVPGYVLEFNSIFEDGLSLRSSASSSPARRRGTFTRN
jgi:hypothetical protein